MVRPEIALRCTKRGPPGDRQRRGGREDARWDHRSHTEPSSGHNQVGSPGEAAQKQHGEKRRLGHGLEDLGGRVLRL